MKTLPTLPFLCAVLLGCGSRPVFLAPGFTAEEIREITYGVESWQGSFQISNHGLEITKDTEACEDMTPQHAGYFSGSKICLRTPARECPLYRVTAHELGHALGLGHRQRPSVMSDPCTDATNFPTQEDLDAVH